MPRLRLTGSETVAIATALESMGGAPPPPDPALREALASPAAIAEGKKLIRRLGCFGCHVIPGMEGESRVSVELTTFGSKPVEELFFGTRTDLPRTWEAWTENKLRTPRTYATERIVQNMPQFGLDRADARALTVYLAGQTRDAVGAAYLPFRGPRQARLRAGRVLVDRYNCHGCHRFDGRDAAIARYYEDDPENAPPILIGEGAKLQPEWFFEFLMKPVRLRPWLTVRMPSFDFSQREATAIVDFFSALENREARPVIVTEDTGGRPVHRRLPAGSYDCYACHPDATRSGGGTVSTVPLHDAEIAEWLEENLGISPETTASGSGR